MLQQLTPKSANTNRGCRQFHWEHLQHSRKTRFGQSCPFSWGRDATKPGFPAALRTAIHRVRFRQGPASSTERIPAIGPPDVGNTRGTEAPRCKLTRKVGSPWSQRGSVRKHDDWSGSTGRGKVLQSYFSTTTLFTTVPTLTRHDCVAVCKCVEHTGMCTCGICEWGLSHNEPNFAQSHTSMQPCKGLSLS